MIAQANIQRLPLADNSIDLIFTDPPYPREYLQTYSWLAQEAARVLKPGGFCLAMCGGYMLDKVFSMMGEFLNFHWKYELFLGEVSTVIWPCHVIARSKPIVAYVKGEGRPQCNVLSAMVGGGNNKKFHHWGQDVESARYYIETHSATGDTVLDPFIGGGTTKVACELIGRRCIALDLDMAACVTTRDRLSGEFIPTQNMLL